MKSKLELPAWEFRDWWESLSLNDRLALPDDIRKACLDRFNGMPVIGPPFEANQPRVFGALSKSDNVLELWRRGLPAGDKTGWPSVDKHYTVAPGQFTVITGWPGSGKSEWLDAMLINLSKQAWKIVYFSPENSPTELHIAKLMEKLAGKPFGAGPNQRISEDEIPEYLDELHSAFRFIEFESGALNPAAVLAAAEPWLMRHLSKDIKRGLVIDPWNELEHWRTPGLSETEYVSATLSMVRGWARANNVHVWIVAHPQKMRRDEGGKLPVPKPDMISGSAHWWNKADCAITVYRDLHAVDSRAVEIHVQKIRFKHIGLPGLVTLNYDRITGRYLEQKQASLYSVTKDGE